MNTPWLAQYDQGVPRSIGAYPDQTLADLIALYARTTPNATALAFKGRRLSWLDLERDASALASGLARIGIAAGDRVALILPNCPQFVICTVALWKLGAAIHPLNPIYTERETEECLREIEPRTVIALTPFYRTI